MAAPVPRPLRSAAAEQLATCGGQYRHQSAGGLPMQSTSSIVLTTVSLLLDTCTVYEVVAKAKQTGRNSEWVTSSRAHNLLETVCRCLPQWRSGAQGPRGSHCLPGLAECSAASELQPQKLAPAQKPPRPHPQRWSCPGSLIDAARQLSGAHPAGRQADCAVPPSMQDGSLVELVAAV